MFILIEVFLFPILWMLNRFFVFIFSNRCGPLILILLSLYAILIIIQEYQAPLLKFIDGLYTSHLNLLKLNYDFLTGKISDPYKFYELMIDIIFDAV